ETTNLVLCRMSVEEGIHQLLPGAEILYAKGCDYADSRWPLSEILPEPPNEKEKAQIDEAVKLAGQAEAVVVVLGESDAMVGESKSRTSLDLPGFQNDLVRALAGTGKPIVAVILGGRPLTINLVQAKVPAVLVAWFPGEYGGQAVAEALFGDLNPGGKLPVTFPRSVGQIEFNFPAKPASQAGMGKGEDPNGAGNSLVTGALYPFGHGLSYTEFSYANLKVNPATIRPGEEVEVSVEVKNSGKTAGDEVVQLYLKDLLASVIPYEKVLRGFERISLKPGEKKTVRFKLGRADMELIDSRGQRTVEPGDFVVEAGSSSTDIRQSTKLVVSSP
ncbi:MAG: glycoside hydrolase family 3 C-terminal domain-containing protein, partial [Verrucomicrobiota bacterium]